MRFGTETDGMTEVLKCGPSPAATTAEGRAQELTVGHQEEGEEDEEQVPEELGS